MSDLDLVLHAVDARGARCIPDLVGDFAVVFWDARGQTLFAVRDALGIRPLFVRHEEDHVLLSTRATLLAPQDENFDVEFIGEYLLGGRPVERTAYGGVDAVSPGAIARWQRGSSSVARYWSPERFEIDERLALQPQEQSEAFRDQFAVAVRACISDGTQVWSQLSGGLDSSSIVSMAQWLAETGQVRHGVAGTVTHVPGMGGDEREYSDAVVERWSVRNEVVGDHWMFQDDGAAPPRTDQPYPAFPLYARDRRSALLVRGAGGRVLLTGHGPDQYLTGTRYFLADLLGDGRLLRFAQEVVAWAVAERRSVWRTGFEFGIVPLLPPILGRRLVKGGTIPDWITPSFARRFELRDRLPAVRQLSVPAGRKFDGPVFEALAHASSGPAGGVVEDLLEIRSPFLYRPLVELALRLPPSLRIRPRTTKWIQREAMRGILPEKVRCRRTKGAIDGRLEWSLARERERIDALLNQSVLADLGCIDLNALRRALGAARGGDSTALGAVVPVLSLESWLQVRTGRWPLGAQGERIGTSSPTTARPSIAGSLRR